MTLDFESDFDIYHLNYVHDIVYAIGKGNILYVKQKDAWKQIMLPKDHVYNKIAQSPDKNIWISGVKEHF